MTFQDNSLIPLLFGEHNSHLHYLEDVLNVDIASRGNTVSIKGPAKAMQTAEAVLEMMWSRLEKNQDVSISDVDAALRFARGERTGAIEPGPHSARENFLDEKAGIKGGGSAKVVNPRSPNQSLYIDAMRKNDMVFGIGPAGTGKTFLAVAAAVEMYRSGEVERLVCKGEAECIALDVLDFGEVRGVLFRRRKGKFDQIDASEPSFPSLPSRKIRDLPQ